MRTDRFLWGVTLASLAGLALAGLPFRNALNPDAVAYLRIAEYCAAGKWDLCVSGYWGPLASWLMAVPLKLGCPPLLTARLFMGCSAIVFLWGCVAVYRAFQIPERVVSTSAALTALAGLYWSVQFITPDLLQAGLIGFAVSRLVAPISLRTSSTSIKAGLLWGLAYLAKAIAFPLAIATTLMFGGLAWRNEPANHARILRNLALTFLAFGLIAGPWVIVLSLKYQKLTFSTTPAISHTLTGPPDRDRYHPFARTFHQPPAGRITDWEEPSRMAYNYWSPFESPAYAQHQLKVLARNTLVCLVLLTSLNLAGPLFLIGGIFRWQRGGNHVSTAVNWNRALIVPGLLVLLYLPCYVTLTEQRFFYSAFPFLIVALAGWLLQKTGPESSKARSETQICGYLTAGVLIPLLAALFIVGASPKLAGDCAADLAKRIERVHLAGPVAGSASLPGGRTGLYLAFLLNQPWYGDELHPTAADLKNSGASLAVVIRGSNLAAELDRDAGFVDLDQKLFSDTSEADRCPAKVFQINPPSPAPDR